MQIKTIDTGYFGQNAYVLIKDDECLVIDPGNNYEEIAKNIADNKLLGVLLTHSHFDHIGALEEIVDNYQVPVYKHSNLKEGKLSLGSFLLEVIYTPGHSKDSITYFFPKEKTMFTGDFLFADDIGRTDLEGGSMKEMQESLAKIFKYPLDTKIYPGHEETSTLESEEKNHKH